MWKLQSFLNELKTTDPCRQELTTLTSSYFGISISQRALQTSFLIIPPSLINYLLQRLSSNLPSKAILRSPSYHTDHWSPTPRINYKLPVKTSEALQNAASVNTCHVYTISLDGVPSVSQQFILPQMLFSFSLLSSSTSRARINSASLMLPKQLHSFPFHLASPGLLHSQVFLQHHVIILPVAVSISYQSVHYSS